jgi:hypothetical protein
MNTVVLDAIVVQRCHHSPGLNAEICKRRYEEPLYNLVLVVLRVLLEVGGKERRTCNTHLTALHPPQTENGASQGPFSASLQDKTHIHGGYSG